MSLDEQAPDWKVRPGDEWHVHSWSPNEIVWQHNEGHKQVQFANEDRAVVRPVQHFVPATIHPVTKKYVVAAVSIGAGCTLALDALLHLLR